MRLTDRLQKVSFFCQTIIHVSQIANHQFAGFIITLEIVVLKHNMEFIIYLQPFRRVAIARFKNLVFALTVIA